MGAGSKVVQGVLNKLIDSVVPGVDDAARQSSAPMLSRRLMVQDSNKSALSGQGGDYYFGTLLDNPDFKAIDDQLDVVSQEYQYNIDPDFYDDQGINVTDIIPMTDTKDQALGEAYLHYFSDGNHTGYSEFFPSIFDSLESLRNKLNVDNKDFARLLEDSGYGPKTNVYATLDDLELDKSYDINRAKNFISGTGEDVDSAFMKYKRKHGNSDMGLLAFSRLYKEVK
jgi:hypothetical protein